VITPINAADTLSSLKLQMEIRKTLSPNKAVELLKKHGANVSVEDAELILDFMNRMAALTIKNYQKTKRTNNADQKAGRTA
jgi:hypothetical protein